MIATEDNKPKRRRAQQVRAKICENCGSESTRVYKTMLIVRYCKCSECGDRWVQTPPRRDYHA